MPGTNLNFVSNAYFLLDAARMLGEFETARSLQADHLSLYSGRDAESLSSVAPYLFPWQPDSEFAKWLLDTGWGNSWGMFVETPASIDALKTHFQKFLIIKSPASGEMYFRFYDPRVLKVFLPTYDTQKIIEFFGPVEKFIVEGDSKETAIGFSHQSGTLEQKKIEVKEVFGEEILIPESQ
jgi:hypothetical protein